MVYPEQSLANVREIPDTYTGKYADTAKRKSLEKKNKSLLCDFVSGHKEMIVELSHHGMTYGLPTKFINQAGLQRGVVRKKDDASSHKSIGGYICISGYVHERRTQGI